jgi:arginine repressor
MTCRYSRHINHEDTALTLQKMLRKLIERGWTQEAIAEELKARGAGGKLRQTTISRVLREDSCRWELGKAIERLYYDVCERDSAA